MTMLDKATLAACILLHMAQERGDNKAATVYVDYVTSQAMKGE
jgi:hypothetical protein